MSSIAKLPEGKLNHLQKKLLITLGFLFIYRVGAHVPVPGVETDALSQFFKTQGANLLGMLNMFTGGALENFSILALGVMPYISASIISQLLTVLVPHLEALSKEGESGRRKINQYTRYGTVILALIQGSFVTGTLADATFGGASLVPDPTTAWKVMTVLSLTAGTCFVMWLGEQITERGVGNGISLIIFCGIVAGLPSVIANTFEQVNNQTMNLASIAVLVAVIIGVTAGVVFIEQGARQVPIQYAKRQIGRRVFGGQQSHLPIRVNSAGVIPPIFASSLLQLPLTIASFNQGSWLGDFIATTFAPGAWLYNTIYGAMIIFFAFFYTSITFKTDDIAENLKKNGGFIPGIRPGQKTADFLQKVVFRLTLAGGLYLAAICIIPTLLTDKFGVQFYFGGTSLLIVVGVALDTFRQIDAHSQSLRYDAFLKPGKIRGRGMAR